MNSSSKDKRGFKPNMASAILVIAAIGVIVALCAGNPASESWPLKCPLYQMTGWQCPLCGMQRAIHEMCHGNAMKAWEYNPALWVSLPYFAVLGASSLFPSIRKYRIIRLAREDRTLLIVGELLIMWGIARNF